MVFERFMGGDMFVPLLFHEIRGSGGVPHIYIYIYIYIYDNNNDTNNNRSHATIPSLEETPMYFKLLCV